jgi:ABC-type glycerol-3-phosphate transport system substrate-binding protein
MQRSCSMYWLRFLLVLLIVVGVSHFAAAKTTITLLAGNVNENIWSAALASFERDNPDIEVRYVSSPVRHLHTKFTELTRSHHLLGAG